MGNAKPFVMSRTYRHARHDLYVYQQKGKLFKLLLVRYSDGSVAYFARNERSRRNAGEALTLIVKRPSQTAFRALTDKGIAPIEPSCHIRATLFAVSPTHHYRVGRPRALKPLGYTVHQEVGRTRPVVFERLFSEYRFHIPLETDGGVVQETWGLLAKQPLIPWQNREAVDALVRLERESAHVMRADGLYTQTPYDPADPAFNYVPAAARSFYRNPANVAGLQALPWLDVRGAHYFDLVLTYMAYTAVQTQHENGYWETHPKANWLAREYKIGHRYMDNRRNVDNATFLHRFAQRKPDPAIRASLAKWDRYHARYIQAYGIPTSRKGLLLPDYVGGPGGKDDARVA